ncbi:AraC family transcriptional regulator [Sorangium cellulosum]|uniref:AraC family transcriptional regulator n=1 Tax=Sorangium cellulosum TaxID=56 RepID=A0A150SP98_SORCE|nr:AraC family transcriptional regulator [Sorangium cellulosum]KYF94456.1 AraC family transcriptional regulator [Sorangium cellulosum]
MDVLTEIMALLRTQGHLYGRLELTAPFGLQFPGKKGICLIVTRGSCLLGVDEQALVPLVGGDFVFLPAPEAYSLRSSPRARLRAAEDVTPPEEFYRSRLIAHGGGGAPVTVVAGCFTFASPDSELLVRHLPPMLHLAASDAHAAPWFQSTLQFIAAEIAQGLPGSPAVVDRLAEVLFVQAMRARIQASLPDGSQSWLRALADPQIGEALRQMHAAPGRAWTVPELARVASMSRSAFAARFRELVGETPLDHLTQWRMVRAASMMRENRPMKLAAIATAVGYESESSFGKVFRRVMGVSPGRYRRKHRLDEQRAE